MEAALNITHASLVRFADERVNLKREDAVELREQVWRLRGRLEAYLAQHPDFELRKMLLSGSLAKGTALKDLNDIDVACYVACDAATRELIPFLAERLRTAFPNFTSQQVRLNQHSVGVSFMGSGLTVDVVPIIYEGDSDWYGYLISQETGEKLLTSIPRHLEFIQRRKENPHFAPIVRLLKYWVRKLKEEDSGFRFKSFMSELLVAHLADGGLNLEDYPTALDRIFAYIATDHFKTAITFPDYYWPAAAKACSDPIRIWDPVNPDNNVAKTYTVVDVARMMDHAREWQTVFDEAA